ncbi:MAG: PH domain-containing protein [Prosthecobacter sp.]
MRTTFNAPWSTSLKVISISVSLFLLAVTCILPLPSSTQPLAWCIVRFLPVILLVGCALFTVRGYEIENGILLVPRLLWKTRIPLQSLTHAEHRPGPFGWAWRTCGNGGLYSFSGWYHQKPLGSFRALATRTTDAVILTFSDGKPIVVTPDDPARFVEEISKSA